VQVYNICSQPQAIKRVRKVLAWPHQCIFYLKPHK